MIDTNAGNVITYNDLNPALPNGNNVVSFTYGGKAIDFNDATTFYNVSTVNYLAAGSCNFNNAGVTLWPLNQIVADTQLYVRDAVINYITNLGTVSPAIEGRLNFASVEFSDVSTSYWGWPWIVRLYDAGLTTGCTTSPLAFCPEAIATRAEMAVFLVRGIHGAGFVPPAATGVFSDVPADYWAAAYIEQLYADGITTGCGTAPLRFCPTDPVTRAEMAVFLVRAKHGIAFTPPAATGDFADVPISHWAAAYIEQLYADGITTGCGLMPLSYCPANSVTRAQAAAFLVRTFDLP